MAKLITAMLSAWLLLIPLCKANAHAKDASTQRNQYVVLISLDGFRHDYIELHGATNISRIAKEGVRASSMTPVYPANTFPNHLSLITGLLPKNHGIVNNRFFDKTRQTKDGYAHYSMGKGKTDSTWIAATPLWNLVELHGLKAATFFWPESDARIGGALPTYSFPYSKYASYQQRVDQMIQWLSLPEVSRPRFVTGYFSLTDTVGHDEGPYSPLTKEAVQKVDALVGELYDRVQALDIDVNVVIVSDHGMTSVDSNKAIDVSTLSIPESFAVENEGAQVHIYAQKETSDEAIAKEASRLFSIANQRYVVVSDAQRKMRHFEKGNRTGDILLEVAPPARFIDDAAGHISKGGHGYLNTLTDMGATFVAAGPAFKKGVALPVFSNLEVYPALAKVMGIAPFTPIDGKLDILNQGLAN
nr:ectonucleotide pyrophosphatase/phosphodiesterase [Alteromonas sp. BMJM2]